MGALELLAKELLDASKRISNSLDGVAEALRGLRSLQRHDKQPEETPTATSFEFRRAAAAIKVSGYTKASYYRLIKEGLQLPFVSLGQRAVGLVAQEQDQVNAARLAGKSDDEIRDLVRGLVAARNLAPNAAVRQVAGGVVENRQETIRGRKGGLKGGKSRMAALTVEQRRELGREAAAKRWGKERESSTDETT
jgi:prophage regulatory protein